MNYLWAIFYGAIQGLTEFLPVSSSGHLALLPYFGNIKDPGLAFDLAMHIGTALSVIVYFRNDVLKMIKNVFNIFSPKDKDSFFTQYFVLATIVSGVLAFLIKPLAELYGRTHLLIAFNLIFFGVSLYVVDKYAKNIEDVFKSKGSVKTSLLVGFFQVLAIFPGVSRSGATISTSVLLGIDREKAARFSFLMVVPLILGKMAKDIVSGDILIESTTLMPLLTGFTAAFITGLFACKWMIQLVKKSKLKYFSFYCFLVGIVSIISIFF